MQTPTVARYCKRCGKKSEFASSGLFRINAQQRHLDIWLVYKCRACDTTWNLEILSRINAGLLAPGLLDRYINNDSELATLHATDSALIKRNGAECCVADVEVVGDDHSKSCSEEIHMASKWSLENKAATIIRQKLNLSGNAFGKMCDEKRIVCLSGHNLKKCKIAGEIVFRINM